MLFCNIYQQIKHELFVCLNLHYEYPKYGQFKYGEKFTILLTEEYTKATAPCI